MPKVSFYLRNEDIDKWKAIEAKTEFIHAALNNTAPRVIKRAVEFGEAIAKHTAKDTKICPHGFEANGWSCKKGCK